MALFWAPRGSRMQLEIAPAEAVRADSAGKLSPARRPTMIGFTPRPALGAGGFYETDDPATILCIQKTAAWGRSVRSWNDAVIVASAPGDGLLTCDVDTVGAVLTRLPGMPVSADPDLDGHFEMPEVAT